MTTATLTKKKRKNIDLTEDVLRKLSFLAVEQGKSLKAYIEDLLTKKAESVEIEMWENPSPSGDKWFMDPNNMKMLKEAIANSKDKPGTAFTREEFKAALGL